MTLLSGNAKRRILSCVNALIRARIDLHDIGSRPTEEWRDIQEDARQASLRLAHLLDTVEA